MAQDRGDCSRLDGIVLITLPYLSPLFVALRKSADARTISVPVETHQHFFLFLP